MHLFCGRSSICAGKKGHAAATFTNQVLRIFLGGTDLAVIASWMSTSFRLLSTSGSTTVEQGLVEAILPCCHLLLANDGVVTTVLKQLPKGSRSIRLPCRQAATMWRVLAMYKEG